MKPFGNFKRGILNIGEASGEVEDRLGHHGGVHRFTIGQRKGLGLSSNEPLYVLEIKPDTAQVVVGPREALRRTTLTASGVN